MIAKQMKKVLLTAVLLCWAVSPLAGQKGTGMTKHAKGAFDVKIAPLRVENPADDSGLGRMSIDKQYHGNLEAAAQGQMLTGMTSVKDSAVYVAVERVNGKLGGNTGTFLLQHSGVMVRGAQHLTITVVEDSGTGELAGITGKLTIEIRDGKHFYDLEYTLPEGH